MVVYQIFSIVTLEHDAPETGSAVKADTSIFFTADSPEPSLTFVKRKIAFLAPS